MEGQTYAILSLRNSISISLSVLKGYVCVVSRIFWKHLNGESCLLEETEKKEKVYIITLVTLRTRSCKGLLLMSLSKG